ncbi:MAG TPA: glycosyltransferase [Gemmatimonadaceae bacterium]|nr:glycosyltransferase [Gemmatimonadaceae bacterium]
MRACFYHGEAEWSGRARAFVEAADALAARDHEITLVCARGGSVEGRFRATPHDVITLRTGGGWMRAGWRLRPVLRRKFVEVVFVHSEREELEASAAVRLADRGAVVRRLPPLAKLTRGGDARLAMRLAATGFLFSLEHDLRATKPPPGALEPAVAPPGIAGRPSVAASPREGGVQTVVVLHDAPSRERMSLALGALALLAARHPELRVSLLGPAIDADALRIHAAALRMGDIVDIVDAGRNHEAVQQRIAAAELGLVLCEADDAAFGMLDCLAAGVPVIAERTVLSAALVTDGETGVLTSGLDSAGYAALLADLLANDARRGQLARGAQGAAARWPLAAMAEGYERVAATARDRSRWRV